jgi:hypothetical protein
MTFVLTQVDSEETLIEKTEFETIPNLQQFKEVAYFVDILEVKRAYAEIIESIGEWVYVTAADEDGFGEHYVDEGVYFLLEEIN